jgi:putative ABC transport system permease protein
VRESSAGYDLIVDSNAADPVTADQLRATPGVTAVAPLLRAFPEFTDAAHPDRQRWSLTGVGPEYLARDVPALSNREAGFTSDRAAWEAVLRRPGLVMVPEFFLNQGGPTGHRPEPGDVVSIYARGQQLGLRVAGVVSSDWVFGGAMVSADFARTFLGSDASPSRAFVAVAPGVDGDALAQRLTARLLTHGVDARTIRSDIEQGLHQQEGFFTLMQGYLALGLLVGVAGLGVVMVRAVRERRRQIGMLRAIGFPSRVVRTAFLLEAGFVAAQGVIVGVVLALVVSYQVLTSSDAFGDQRLDFSVPWLVLGVVLLATVLASLVAVLAPATQASRIKPAVALRITD